MPMLAASPPLVLSIAGFDPTAGAGIGADIKVIAANQCYGVACISALTVQDTHGVRSYRPIPGSFFEEQLDCLLGDVQPRAVKIGMLANRETVEIVARQLERHPIPWVVLDPIYAATNGTRLIDDAGWIHLRKRLLPLASVLTPNIEEATLLSGVAIAQQTDMEQAATLLHAMGPAHVVIKGGHLERPVDLLYSGDRFIPLSGDRVRTSNTHGTGCTFSAALASALALGKRVEDAVVMAKAYLTAALRASYPISSGAGPLNHLYRLQEPAPSRNVDPAPQPHFTSR